MAVPFAVPLVAGAVGAARALGPRMAPYWSRYGVPVLQGLQRYGAQTFTKQNLVNALKQAPMLFAEDVVLDQAGKVVNPLVERYGDARGLYKSLHSTNPAVPIIDGGLTALDINYEKIPTKISSLFTNVAEASDLTPEEINLSTQYIPSPRRTDIRLNEPLFANPKGFTGYQFIRGSY